MDDIQLKISQMSLQEAYEIYKTYKQMNDEESMIVRFGYEIPFDLDSLFNNTLYIVIRKKKGTIKINRKTYKISDFNTELNIREKIVKTYIIENSSGLTIAKPRGLEDIPKGINT